MLRVAVLLACVAASLSKPTQRRNVAGTWNYDRCDVREMLTPAVHALRAECCWFPSMAPSLPQSLASLPARRCDLNNGPDKWPKLCQLGTQSPIDVCGGETDPDVKDSITLTEHYSKAQPYKFKANGQAYLVPPSGMNLTAGKIASKNRPALAAASGSWQAEPASGYTWTLAQENLLKI
jgi:hypothetical protein